MKVVKKNMLIIGIVLLALIVLIAAFIIYNSKKPVAPADYTKTVETGGAIEGKYMANGTYEVSYFEEPVLQGFGKYVLYYPAELESTDKTWPVVVVANGSGCKASKYPTLFEHLASWGFIVIGTEEEYDWNGFASEMCVRHLIRLNEIEIVNDKDNPFRGKIDLDNVGITGHSQGAVGVINAITAQEHKDIFKAAVSLSPTNKELAHNLEWDFDASKISAPILIMGGDNDWVATKEQFKSIYDDIPGEKCMALRKDTEHGPMLYSGDGYVTAWFMYWLQGDEYAGKAFFGENAEIHSNAFWQDTDIFFQKDEENKLQ
ncbi:MAG: alpha/beta hydrolase family protein [Anaerovoracaceae bacterium]